MKPRPSEVLTEEESRAPRKDCAEGGVSIDMTVSCDVVMPPLHHKEVFIALERRGGAALHPVSFALGCPKNSLIGWMVENYAVATFGALARNAKIPKFLKLT